MFPPGKVLIPLKLLFFNVAFQSFRPIVYGAHVVNVQLKESILGVNVQFKAAIRLSLQEVCPRKKQLRAMGAEFW